MRQKHVNLRTPKEIASTKKIEEEREDLLKLETEPSFKEVTQKEKIQAASKPLYLKRYE